MFKISTKRVTARLLAVLSLLILTQNFALAQTTCGNVTVNAGTDQKVCGTDATLSASPTSGKWTVWPESTAIKSFPLY